MRISKLVSALGLTAFASTAAMADTPQYTIIDLGALTGEVSQAFSVSNNGAAIVGRSFNTSATPTAWDASGSMTALSKLPGRAHAVAYGVNDSGMAVGVASTSISGSGALPVMWQNGQVSQLALPGGYSVGHAYGVNSQGVVAGSVGGGSSEVAAVFANGGVTVLPQMASGAWMTTAFAVNDSGWVVGNGVDPAQAARNLGLVYDMNTGTTFEIGVSAGHNGSLLFDVSNAGHVVGSTMNNQGNGTPFIWTQAGGMVDIPLLPGTSYGGAYGVNASGWVVGSDGGQYSNPFLYADGAVYRIADLLPANSGWDFVTNTAASARSISDNGTIVGTAYHNGVAHAYEMVLVSAVPEPDSYALMLAGLGVVAGIARRRSSRSDSSAARA